MKQPTLEEISLFLTEEVVQKAFRIRTASDDSVKCIKVSQAAPVGEGLLSVVYRIHVTGFQHATSFVVKALIKDPLLRRTLAGPNFFKREVDFFTKMLPVLSELQIYFGAKERIQNHIPIIYGYHQDGVNDYLLLEDLSESGCNSLPVAPSEEQRNDVLKVLAHFHAVSMALRIKRPEVFRKEIKDLSEVYMSEENREWFAKYMSNAVDIDRSVIIELEDLNSVYFKKFGEVVENDPYGQIVAAVCTPGDHPVLCHGDAWSPNFFRSPDRTVTIDFQTARCASPATDLTYWNILCCNKHTSVQDFKNAVDVYYNSLQYFLQDMGVDAAKVFPRAALDRELSLYGRFGFLASLTTLPLLSSDRVNFSNFSKAALPGVDRLPLETIWNLTPMKEMDDKLRLVTALHIAVDMRLI